MNRYFASRASRASRAFAVRPSSLALRVGLTALTSLVLAAGAGAPRLAHACSPPRSCEAIVPGEGGSFPASTPAIPVTSAIATGPQSQDEVALQLRTAAGDVVPGVLTKDKAYHRFFVPNAPLVPGTYTMTLPNGCAGASGTSFTVSAAQPLPTQAGKLRVVRAARVNGTAGTSSGSCSEVAIDAAVVDLGLDLATDATPYASVLAWSMRVDGQVSRDATGALRTPEAANTSMSGILRLYTACDVGTSGRQNGLPPGVHDIELTPTLVGSTAALAPAKLRVKVTCGADNGEVVVVPPPVVPPPGQPPVDGPPASADNDGANAGVGATGGQPVEESSDSGCSASSRAPAGGVGSAVAGLLVAMLVAARRERRRSSR